MNLYSLEIDLHGLTSDEASINVLNALFTLDQNEFMEYVDIIVGNGTKTLQFAISNLLEDEKYDYEFLNSNHSVIRAYKKN
ncbi:Smr/MutS family protein [Mycoplasma sp. 332]|uniref:Smr/MutS family protein n=1 Tax=unclassified Asterococcus (in: mycoplasmas, genus) TaxID=3407551 RepID=UPI003F65BEC9